jgi:hypothetical protein
MGLYMKVPPRSLFWCQLIATLWSCFVQVGVVSMVEVGLGLLKLTLSLVVYMGIWQSPSDLR